MAATKITLDFAMWSQDQVPDQFKILESAVHLVKDDLERSGISVKETYSNPQGTLGPEWLPVLTAILSGPAILLSIRAIRDVLKTYLTNRSSLTVIVKKDGKEVTLDARNIDSVSEHEIAAYLGLSK